MGDTDSLVSGYNKAFLSILTMSKDHFSRDEEVCESIMRLRERVMLMKNFDHESLLKLSGPYIMEYRDMINKKNLSDFTEDKLKGEIAKLNKEDKAVTIFRYFGLAKRLYDEIGEEERSKLFEKLSTLLQNYIKYCIATKKN